MPATQRLDLVSGSLVFLLKGVENPPNKGYLSMSSMSGGERKEEEEEEEERRKDIDGKIRKRYANRPIQPNVEIINGKFASSNAIRNEAKEAGPRYR